MRVTRGKKRWVLASILFLLVFGIVFRKADLWYQQSDKGHELYYTENTYGIVASNGDTIQQSFVAQEECLETISILMVPREQEDKNNPIVILTDEVENILVESRLQVEAETGMMKADINQKLQVGKTYALTVIFENVQNSYSVYLVPTSDLTGNYRESMVGGEESGAVLFVWYSYTSHTLDLLLLFLIPFLFIEFMLLLEFENSVILVALKILGIFCCIVLCINAINRMAQTNPLDMLGKAWIVTVLWLFALVGMGIVLTNRMDLGFAISFGICFLYGVVAHYVMRFRGTPFLPIDLFAVKTAKEVVANYTYTINDDTMILALVSYIIILAFGACMKQLIVIRGKKRMIPLVLFGMICGIMSTSGFTKKVALEPYYYSQEDGNRMYGAIFNFLTNIQSCFREMPEGYSVKRVEEIAEIFVSDNLQERELPNLIVVMNESWADISKELGVEVNVMPNIEAISKEENAISGNVVVSTYGGGTNLSEFQFLTGSVKGFGLTGSCYDLDCTEGVTSLVSVLKELGYYTVALHPAYYKNWDRDIGYEKLGFDEYLALEDLSEYSFDYTRSYKYASDSSLYKVIYDLTENTGRGDKPIFIFCITIQNHGDYNDESYVPTVNVEDVQYAQYLSLIKETDCAFAEMVEHYRADENETIIMMFGDHLPLLDNLDKVIGEGTIERYTTPYIIWSNKSLEYTGEAPTVSLNYLQTVLFDVADLPLTGYQKLLKKMAEVYPVISKGKYYNVNMEGKWIEESSLPQELNDYKIVQYNNLFGEEQRNTQLFSY